MRRHGRRWGLSHRPTYPPPTYPPSAHLHRELDLRAVRRQQTDGNGNGHRPLLGLARRRRRVLARLDCKRAGRRVVRRLHLEVGRARLLGPAGKLGQVHGVGVRHGRPEVVARDRRAVMARKIQVHALAEAGLAQQALVHAHHFRPFLVHGQRVKVIHLGVWWGKAGRVSWHRAPGTTRPPPPHPRPPLHHHPLATTVP